MSNKRSRSSICEQEDSTSKRVCVEDNSSLLSELSQVLNTIKSTPSSGEISAEVMETFKILLLEIDQLSADESNIEAKQMKQESELCLESWFDDLLARCEADGELNLEDLESICDSEDGDSIAFAMAQEDEEEDEDEEIIIVDDEGSEIGAPQALVVL
ncbi:hypothetical protein BDF21DRAFT_407171 [Thamnidium elegans]|uniref:Uncharacterized protein n=1 Tax=Thamnidium elegans TaxID=101142 RepID=A0A8H7SLK4_9FUNG|nr:hypothetical protein INT48_006826 [Thamnidium elegans]KAI8095968.1 hypothetical protein BDF21DRAFT_407171 [Thamnidium elegans]